MYGAKDVDCTLASALLKGNGWAIQFLVIQYGIPVYIGKKALKAKAGSAIQLGRRRVEPDKLMNTS